MKLKVKKEKENLKKIVELINKSKEIALITHKSPDGDGFGSLLAMRLALLSKRHKVFVFCIDGPNSIYNFLPGILEIKEEFDFKKPDLLIFLDCASFGHAGFLNKKDFKNRFTISSINIDHHSTNEHFADYNLVVTSVSSTSEIVYKILLELNVEIDKDIATCLLTGIYHDTGSFMHSNTSISNLNLASKLLLAGGRKRLIFRNIYTGKPLKTLRLWGQILANIKQNVSGITYSIITRKEMEELEATKEDLEGAVDLVRLVSGTKIALFVSEEEGYIKGSLRTEKDNIDVSRLASVFGGGGHKKAAGFRIKGKLLKTKSGFEII